MPSICFYFQVHQPWRLRKYQVFDIGKSKNYFDDTKNHQVLQKVADKCYLPTNRLMHSLIEQHNGDFKIAYSISGVAIEQFQEYCPEVLESFMDLADTGCVEFLDETFYHSLAWLHSKDEFKRQIQMHRHLMKSLFNYTPKVFRNTELIFNNEIAKYIEGLGYEGIVAEGADHVLGWRSPNFIYKPKTSSSIKLLLKNYKLSDDIAFRFSNRNWNEWPLTTGKYCDWVKSVQGDTINLFMDYETFGEHQWRDTGIFNFMKQLPETLLKSGVKFKTPSETIKAYNPVAEIDIHNLISWADTERDLSAWVGNKMQDAALREIYKIESAVVQANDPEMLNQWRRLQTSDHFYYMCTKWFSDGDVHKYFNPYDSPYDSFITFMNVLQDLTQRVGQLQMNPALNIPQGNIVANNALMQNIQNNQAIQGRLVQNNEVKVDLSYIH
jgi:alpha-amylase